jgi:acetyl esterase/lipase
MPSWQARLLALGVRLIGVRRVYDGEKNIRRSIAADRKRGPALPHARLRERFFVEQRRVAGRTVFTLSPRDRVAQRHLLYLHGGGYVLSIMDPHWKLIETLLDRLNCAVTVPFYPLAPEQTVGDVWAMLLPLYQALTAEIGAGHLTVMGDSAGGNLALSLAMQVRDRSLPLPARVVMISPSLDVTFTDPAMQVLDRMDPITSLRGCRVLGRLYAGDLDPRDPVISPLFGSLKELPPLAIFTGTRDIVNVDARRLREKAAGEGAPLAWFEYPEMLHVWPLFPLPEAKRAIDQIVTFIGDR